VLHVGRDVGQLHESFEHLIHKFKVDFFFPSETRLAFINEELQLMVDALAGSAVITFRIRPFRDINEFALEGQTSGLAIMRLLRL